jgi:hypothetical protein
MGKPYKADNQDFEASHGSEFPEHTLRRHRRRSIRRRHNVQLVSNVLVERRGVALRANEADLSRSSTHSLAHRRRRPAIAPTDC